MFVFLERETNYQFVHSAWHVSMAVAILFLLPRSPSGTADEDKYAMLETRPPTSMGTGYFPPPSAASRAESSFKHYPEDMDNGPEVINMTANASTTLLPASEGTLRSTASLAALNNGGGGTLPRSSLVRNYAHSHHGTLKKSADELRPLTAMDGPYHGHSGHSHKPSMDTLRRVHFEKSTKNSPSSNNGITPASPPKIILPANAVSTASSIITTAGGGNGVSTVVTTAAGTLPPSLPSHEDDDEDEGDTAM